MSKVYSVCDLCFDSLAALSISAAGRWLLYCECAKDTCPYIIYKLRLDFRMRAGDEDDLRILESKGFLITQETQNDLTWIVKLLGFDTSSGSVCVHYHKRHQEQKRRGV